MVRHAVPLLLVSLALAGCGSGHHAKPPLSAAAFRAQANEVCAQAKTHAGRLAGLRKLRPPLADADLYARWLKAERDAIEAAKPPKHTTTEPLFDPHIATTIAEGKISGYARRLGARGCE